MPSKPSSPHKRRGMSLAEVREAVAQAQAALRGDGRGYGAHRAAPFLDRARKLLAEVDAEGDEENTRALVIETANSAGALSDDGHTGAAEPLARWAASACGLDDRWPENVKHGLPPTKEYMDMAAVALGDVLFAKGDYAGVKACAELWVNLSDSPPPTRALQLLANAEVALGNIGGAGAVNSNRMLDAPAATPDHTCPAFHARTPPLYPPRWVLRAQGPHVHRGLG